MVARKYFTEKTIYISIQMDRNPAMYIYGRKKYSVEENSTKALEADCAHSVNKRAKWPI